jgi:molecular chaperone HscC
LRRQAERAKRALGTADEAAIEIVFEGKPISWTLKRERFEQIGEPLLARVRAPLERALRDARIAPEQITRIIFAGGATRMTDFRRLIGRLFRQLPVQSINPDEVVARGAVVRAGMAMQGKGLEEHILTDVAPFTLGVEVSNRTAGGGLLNGLFLPVIERNTLVPASRSHLINTLENNQTQVRIPVYQGESRFVRDNVYLGELTVGVPPAPAGKEMLEVRFSYDSSGLLDVDVTVLSTKAHQNLTIEGNPGVLSREEVQSRLAALAKLKVHPRDEAENIAVLARAKRVFEESLGDARIIVGQWIDAFSELLERQDPEAIGQGRARLTELLDSVDRNFLT